MQVSPINIHSRFSLISIVLAVALYAAARAFFLKWYEYQAWADYMAAAGFTILLAVMLIIFYVPIQRLRQSTRSHLLLMLLLLFILLPWAEWLQIGLRTNRQDWSLQWLNKLFFVYCCTAGGDVFARILEPEILASNLRKVQGRWSYIIFPILMFLLSLFFIIYFKGAVSHIQDGSSYLFQGKIFASGQLWAKQPSLQDFFYGPGDMMYMGSGKWFSIFLPGYPLFLAAGWMIKAPYLISPLAAAISLWFLMRLIGREFSQQAAIWFAILFLFSPFVLSLSSEFMSHTTELAVASAALYAISGLLEKPDSIKFLLLLCAALVAGALVRIFSIYPFLTPSLAYFSWKTLRSKRYFALLPVALAIFSGIALLFWYQYQTGGNPFVSGYALKCPECRYGFTRTFLGQIHSPLLGLENTSNHLNSLNNYTSGWPSGSFILPILFFVLARKFSVWEKILLLSSAAVLVFYFFFVGIDLDLGPRMIFLVTPTVLLMNVRGAELAWRAFSSKGRMVIAILLIASVVGYFGFEFAKYFRTLDLRESPSAKFQQQINQYSGKRVLVFVQNESRYSDFLFWNDASLSGALVVARDLDARNPELISRYPSYEPLYYRRAGVQDETHPFVANGAFGLFRDRTEEKEVSYFEMVLAIQTAADDWRDDLFDLFPTMGSDCISLRHFLIRSQNANPTTMCEPQKNFRLGLRSLVSLLILPQCAYEESQDDWLKSFDPEQFRTLFYSCENSFRKSGELGGEIREGLKKLRARIDTDKNGDFSDAEIIRFVSVKIKELKKYSFFRS